MEHFEEFVTDFLVESREGLQEFEECLLQLENSPRDGKALSGAFRVLHTVKGSSGFLGFESLRNLAHSGESLLGRARDGELELDSPTCQLLFDLLDNISTVLTAVESTGLDDSVDLDEITKLLDQAASIERPFEVPKQQAVSDATLVLTESVADDEGVGEDAVDSSATDPQTESTKNPEPSDDSTDQDIPVSICESSPAAEKSQPTISSDATPATSQQGGEIGSDPNGGSASSLAVSTIRVDVDLLDRLMNLVGELVLTRNHVLQITAGQQDSEFLNMTQRLNQIVSDLQDGIMKTRMQPIGSIWQKIPRLVRDVAHQCGKRVRLDLEGSETELDKSMIEGLNDPTLHVVRNAIDHGIEAPAERKSLGKPEEGQLSLRAFHEGGQVIIEITDDGAGLDAESIRTKGVQQGLIPEEEARGISPEELYQWVFLPGFSTAESVTQISGRGVGMDVVKTEIERVGGTITLLSSPGKGTTIRITVPLTLAIIPALIFTSDGQRYAIPQRNVLELLCVLPGDRDTRLEHIVDTSFLRLRGQQVPIIDLRKLLLNDKPCLVDDSQTHCVVVLRCGNRRLGLVVDDIRDTQEIVVKPLNHTIKNIGLYTGATIMGDGTVAMILDVLGMARKVGLFTLEEQRAYGEDSRIMARVDAEKRVLVCELVQGRRVAIPMEHILRVEQIDSSAIEHTQHGPVVQYRGQILTILDLQHVLEGTAAPFDADRLQVVLYRSGKYPVGIVVHRIIDIAVYEPSADRDNPVPDHNCVLSTEVVLGAVTDVVSLTTIVNDIAPQTGEYHTMSSIDGLEQVGAIPC
jgi:two-component system chemotaxis sensor kinase CheA